MRNASVNASPRNNSFPSIPVSIPLDLLNPRPTQHEVMMESIMNMFTPGNNAINPNNFSVPRPLDNVNQMETPREVVVSRVPVMLRTRLSGRNRNNPISGPNSNMRPTQLEIMPIVPPGNSEINPNNSISRPNSNMRPTQHNEMTEIMPIVPPGNNAINPNNFMGVAGPSQSVGGSQGLNPDGSRQIFERRFGCAECGSWFCCQITIDEHSQLHDDEAPDIKTEAKD